MSVGCTEYRHPHVEQRHAMGQIYVRFAESPNCIQIDWAHDSSGVMANWIDMVDGGRGMRWSRKRVFGAGVPQSGAAPGDQSGHSWCHKVWLKSTKSAPVSHNNEFEKVPYFELSATSVDESPPPNAGIAPFERGRNFMHRASKDSQL